jgi:hypothetical protein
MQKTRYRVAIIDDDPVIGGIMTVALNGRFPELDTYLYTNPDIIPKMDIYFIDNEFNGKYMASRLLLDIREVNPNALIIAMSATLELKTVEYLMNHGCNGVWDKNHIGSQSDDVYTIIENYINIMNKVKAKKDKQCSLKSIQNALSKWNKKLAL